MNMGETAEYEGEKPKGRNTAEKDTKNVEDR
jgi:hypothetical protein